MEKVTDIFFALCVGVGLLVVLILIFGWASEGTPGENHAHNKILLIVSAVVGNAVYLGLSKRKT